MKKLQTSRHLLGLILASAVANAWAAEPMDHAAMGHGDMPMDHSAMTPASDAMQGMDQWFGEVVVPKEQVTEFKSGKKRIVQKKLYPGYILVNMILSDETWFLVRETGGIGDFTGSGGKPSPMLPQDVAKLLNKGEEKAEETPKLKINFKKGDRVKINEGTFENFEGEVEQIDEANGRVTVMLSIFGRSTPVDIEYWQIETV